MGQRGLIAALLAVAPVAAQDIEPGKIVDRVVCRGNERQSYALYVPSSYSKDLKWPILYCLDPGARGRLAVERFAAAAERHGYIVAGSNNSRNGPWAPAAEAIDAIVGDTRERLSIDAKRAYAAGFSGAGSMVLTWARGGFLAGIVVNSNPGTAEGLPGSGFRVFATAGLDDFNYCSVHAMSVSLAKQGIPSRFREFEGQHEWLPAAAAEEALQYFDRRLPAQPAVESKDVRKMADRLQALREKLLDPRAGAALPLQADAAGPRGDAGLDPDTQRQALIKLLVRDAAKPEDGPERRVARQALGLCFVANTEMAREKMAAGDYAAAARLLEWAVSARPAEAMTWFALAVARSASGNRRGALDALKSAVANGYRDAARVEREPLLEPMRRDKRYPAVLEDMRKNSSGT